MTRQSFFEGGRYLGSREIDPTFQYPGDTHDRIVGSVYYWCPRCAAIWGAVVHEHPDTYNQCVTQFCLRHVEMNEFRVGGFLAWNPSDKYTNPTDFAPDWPPDAVEYQFRAELSWARLTIGKGVHA